MLARQRVYTASQSHKVMFHMLQFAELVRVHSLDDAVGARRGWRIVGRIIAVLAKRIQS